MESFEELLWDVKYKKKNEVWVADTSKGICYLFHANNVADTQKVSATG